MQQKFEWSKPFLASMMAAAVFVLGGTTAIGAGAIPTPKVSQANADNFRELVEAYQAKRFSEVDAKAKAVLSNSQRTKDDTFAAHGYLLQTAQARNDVSGQMQALEGQLSSGFLPQSAQASYYRNLIGLAYKLPDYRKAIEYGQQLIKMGDASPEVYQWVGQAYYELKDYKSAVDFFNNLVTQKEKAGRKPDRNELILLQSSYLKVGNKEAARATLQKVVKYYPDASTWQALLHDVKTARLDKVQKLQLYRLMHATKNLQGYKDFMAYSDAATAMGLLAESQQVLEDGLKANVFPAGADRDRAERYRKSAINMVAQRRAELPALEAAAKSAATGDEYIELGRVYMSFAQFDKAVAALQAGIAKGNLKNPADARMNLGLALLKSGQKAEALKAFRAADSSDDVTQRIAELWALYAS
jgi:tetratricopeptide (TPR) repeat protein